MCNCNCKCEVNINLIKCDGSQSAQHASLRSAEYEQEKKNTFGILISYTYTVIDDFIECLFAKKAEIHHSTELPWYLVVCAKWVGDAVPFLLLLFLVKFAICCFVFVQSIAHYVSKTYALLLLCTVLVTLEPEFIIFL